jgi:hypothetical protein
MRWNAKSTDDCFDSASCCIAAIEQSDFALGEEVQILLATMDGEMGAALAALLKLRAALFVGTGEVVK